MQLRSLRGDGEERFLPRRTKRIPHEQRAVRIAKERNVSGAVTRRVYPTPPRKGWHSSVSRQLANVPADIDRMSRVQARHSRHHAATHRGIGRRIRSLARRVWKFITVRVNRYIPLPQQGVERAHVIEVGVGQEDGVRLRVAEVFTRPSLNAAGGSIKGRVDEGPPGFRGHREHVDEEHAQPQDVWSDGVERNNGTLWDLDAFHTAAGCNCDAGRTASPLPPCRASAVDRRTRSVRSMTSRSRPWPAGTLVRKSPLSSAGGRATLQVSSILFEGNRGVANVERQDHGSPSSQRGTSC